MFHSLINFCIFVFICYAAAGSAKAILFSGKRKANRPARRKAASAARVTPRRQAPVAVRKHAVKPRAKKQAEMIYFNQAA